METIQWVVSESTTPVTRQWILTPVGDEQHMLYIQNCDS